MQRKTNIWVGDKVGVKETESVKETKGLLCSIEEKRWLSTAFEKEDLRV